MYVTVDNYDSFVYNLVAYLQEFGRQINVIRNDSLNINYLEKLISEKKIEGIIISPGPKSPKDCGLSGKIINLFAGKVPILGVCLGHQIIAYELGATVEKGLFPMHGKVTAMNHNQSGVFENIPSPYEVTRYHSLEVKDQNLPDCLQVDARTEDGVIMAIRHKVFPLYGVQFHPEAVLTEHGHTLLKNFIKMSEKWWSLDENNC